jgi:hypothetical protein
MNALFFKDTCVPLENIVINEKGSRNQTRMISLNVNRTLCHICHIFSAVIDFDEQEENLKISGFLSCAWIDEYLKWDNTSFSNILELFIVSIRAL